MPLVFSVAFGSEHQAKGRRSGIFIQLQLPACVTGPSGELYLGQVQRPSQCQAGQTLPDKPRGFGKPGEKQPKVAWLSRVHGCGIRTAPQGQ